MKLVSACLVGVNCNYKGKSRPNKKLIKMLKNGELIPVCPEQLGGLPTPREPSEKRGDRVFTISGKDMTEQYKKGAEEVLKIAKMFIGQSLTLPGIAPTIGLPITSNSVVNQSQSGQVFSDKRVQLKGARVEFPVLSETASMNR